MIDNSWEIALWNDEQDAEERASNEDAVCEAKLEMLEEKWRKRINKLSHLKIIQDENPF